MTRQARLSVVLALNVLLVAGLIAVGVSAHSLGVVAEGADYLADAAAIGCRCSLSALETTADSDPAPRVSTGDDAGCAREQRLAAHLESAGHRRRHRSPRHYHSRSPWPPCSHREWHRGDGHARRRTHPGRRHRLQQAARSGQNPDPRDAHIARLKHDLAALTDRLAQRDQTIVELGDFKTLALSRLAAQHDDITQLRATGANPSNIRRLPNRPRPDATELDSDS